MIISKKSLTLAEVQDYIKGDESKKELSDSLKPFVKTSKSDAIKLMAEINALNNPKMKEENVIKIADFLPKDSEDINKIFLDVALTEEETNAILAIVKKY